MNLANIEQLNPKVCEHCIAVRFGVVNNCKVVEHMMYSGRRPTDAELENIGIKRTEIQPSCPENFNNN